MVKEREKERERDRQIQHTDRQELWDPPGRKPSSIAGNGGVEEALEQAPSLGQPSPAFGLLRLLLVPPLPLLFSGT